MIPKLLLLKKNCQCNSLFISKTCTVTIVPFHGQIIDLYFRYEAACVHEGQLHPLTEVNNAQDVGIERHDDLTGKNTSPKYAFFLVTEYLTIHDLHFACAYDLAGLTALI